MVSFFARVCWWVGWEWSVRGARRGVGGSSMGSMPAMVVPAILVTRVEGGALSGCETGISRVRVGLGLGMAVVARTCAWAWSGDRSSMGSMPAILVTRSRNTISCSDWPDLRVLVMYWRRPTSSIEGYLGGK